MTSQRENTCYYLSSNCTCAWNLASFARADKFVLLCSVALSLPIEIDVSFDLDSECEFESDEDRPPDTKKRKNVQLQGIII